MDRDTFTEDLKRKVDQSVYWQLVPPGKDPKDHLRAIVTDANEIYQKQLHLQVKVWDQKLAQFRSEVNVAGINKKLSTMVTSTVLDEMRETFDSDVDKVLLKINQVQ